MKGVENRGGNRYYSEVVMTAYRKTNVLIIHAPRVKFVWKGSNTQQCTINLHIRDKQCIHLALGPMPLLAAHCEVARTRRWVAFFGSTKFNRHQTIQNELRSSSLWTLAYFLLTLFSHILTKQLFYRGNCGWIFLWWRMKTCRKLMVNTSSWFSSRYIS